MAKKQEKKIYNKNRLREVSHITVTREEFYNILELIQEIRRLEPNGNSRVTVYYN